MDSIISSNKLILSTIYFLQEHSVNELETFLKTNPEICSKDYFDKDWKISVFNYYQQENEFCLIYNTIYNSLTRLSKIEYKKLANKKKSIGKKLTTSLFKQGIIVPSSIDETTSYLQWVRFRASVPSSFVSLNITTTLKCNARCLYCYEKGVKTKSFKKDNIDKLISFVEKRTQEGKTSFLLNWFGGEPLLNQNLIDEITSVLEKKQISFSSYLITNGSLITEKNIKEDFPKWKVKDIQITLDGMRLAYERIKNYSVKNKYTFDHIINILNKLSETDIKIHIRLNISETNVNDILALTDFLQKQFSNNENITYYPAFITGSNLQLTEEQKTNIVCSLFEIINDPQKMTISSRLTASPKFRPCMNNDPNSYSIDVDCNVYTCEHLVGRTESSIGNLENLSKQINNQRSNFILEDKCTKCVFLPKCMGGCISNKATGDELCMIEKYMIKGYLLYLSKFNSGKL